MHSKGMPCAHTGQSASAYLSGHVKFSNADLSDMLRSSLGNSETPENMMRSLRHWLSPSSLLRQLDLIDEGIEHVLGADGRRMALARA